MISYSKMASIEYYIEASERLGAKPVQERKGVKRTSSDYYIDMKFEADPLHRPLEIHGPGAQSLGLREGQILDSEQFRNLYFGYTPDGATPIHSGIAGKKEQADSHKEARRLEKVAERAGKDLSKAKAEARERLGKDAEVSADPNVVAAQRNLDLARKTLEKHRKDPAYRRVGEDFTFTLPPDFSIFHARLLADGKLKEARKFEDFFVGLANKEMERASRHVTLKAGRNDAKGIKGSEVEVVWTSVVHFDARPDEAGVTSHQLHVHCPCPNYGRNPRTGEWGPVSFERMKKELEVSDAYISAACSLYIEQNYGADVTLKESEKGKLIPEMGASRHLAENPDHQLHGRHKQIEKNRAAGMKDRKAQQTGKNRKDDLSGHEHIALQKELLKDAGLGMKVILGNRKEREAQEMKTAEERLKLKWQNEAQDWRRLEREYGHPNGRPQPFKGEAARRYMEFLGEMKSQGLYAPVTPPGKPGHDKKRWGEAVGWEVMALRGGQADLVSLSPEKIVDHLTQTTPFFTELELREQIARRLMAYPTDGKVKPEEMLEHIRMRADEEYRKVISSGCCVRSSKDGQHGFTNTKLRAKEMDSYSRTLVRLFESDAGARTMTTGEVETFLKDWERQKGFSFKPKQAQVALDVLTSKSRATIIQGFAGSGKTAIAEAMARMLEKQGYKIIACAPSNSAMDGLRQELKAAAGYTPQSLVLALDKGTVKIDENTVIYLDETSMLDVAAGAELLSAVERSGARILMSGDIKQLSSVGAGNLFEHAFSIAADAERLDPDGGRRTTFINEDFTDAQTIQRQKTRTGKQLVAEMQTGDWGNAVRTMKAGGMLEILETETDCVDAMGRAYRERMEERKGDTPALMRAWQEAAGKREKEAARKRLEAGLRKSSAGYRDNVMLAESNANVSRLAAGARRDLKAMGLLGEKDTMIKVAGRKNMAVAIGERLVLRDKTTTKDALARDGKKAGSRFEFYKGTAGTVVDIKKGADGSPVLVLLLDKPDMKGNERLEISTKDFPALAYGTAMTVHLSQGISVENSFYLPSRNSTSQLGLVACSRFKTSHTVFMPESDEKAIVKAWSKKERQPDALDLALLGAEGETAGVEISARLASATEHERRDFKGDARAAAAESFEAIVERGDPGLDETAEAVRRLARETRLEQIEMAAERGIVIRAGEPDLLDAAFTKNWLGLTEDGMALAHDVRTGRIEAWEGKTIGAVARQTEFGRKLMESLDEARENGKTLEREGSMVGRLVATGTDPLHDSPGGKPTSWVLIEDPRTGATEKVWGSDLGRAIRDAGLKVGDGAALDGDSKALVSIFSSKPFDDGTPGSMSGMLVAAPKGDGPAVVRLENGTEAKVWGAAAEGWKGSAEGARVEVFTKTVEKRIWTATPVMLGSRLDRKTRKTAWEATEKALADARTLDILASVGVGKRPLGHGDMKPQEAALRQWTAGRTEEGCDSIFEWDESAGTGGRKAWHEAGVLTKGSDGVAKAEIEARVLHQDDAHVYCAVAVQNQAGDVEGTASRILAFGKDDLGIGGVDVGERLVVRCSDDSDKPSLVRIGEEREHRTTLAASEQRRILKRVMKGMSQDEIRETLERGSVNADDRHDTDPVESILEVGLISQAPLMNDGLRKPDEKQASAETPETASRETAGVDEVKQVAIMPAPSPVAERLERRRLEEERLAKEQAEREKAAEDAAAKKQAEIEKRQAQEEWVRRTNDAAQRIREMDARDAAKAAAEKVQARRDALEREKPVSEPPHQMVEARVAEPRRVDEPEPNHHHADDWSFELAYTEMLMNGDKEGINDLLAVCPLDKPERMARLINEGGADPVMGTIAGFSADECLAELPTGYGDKNTARLMELGADPFNGIRSKTDGLTFAERHGWEVSAKQVNESASSTAKPAGRGYGRK